MVRSASACSIDSVLLDSISSSSVPTQHSQRAQRNPPARLTHGFAEPDCQRFIVRPIKKPSAIFPPLTLNKVHRIIHPRVALDPRCPEVVKSAQDVVFIARRKLELQELRIRNLARG